MIKENNAKRLNMSPLLETKDEMLERDGEGKQ